MLQTGAPDMANQRGSEMRSSTGIILYFGPTLQAFRGGPIRRGLPSSPRQVFRVQIRLVSPDMDTRRSLCLGHFWGTRRIVRRIHLYHFANCRADKELHRSGHPDISTFSITVLMGRSPEALAQLDTGHRLCNMNWFTGARSCGTTRGKTLLNACQSMRSF